MKKLTSFLIVVFLLIMSYTPTADVRADKEKLTMYAPDGREIVVYLSEVETYKNVGWYENKNDIIRTMYAPDGRETTIYLSEVEAYKGVGWYENRSDVIHTLYAYDGREITVFLCDVPLYQSLGWYADRNEVIAVMSSPNKQKMSLSHYIALKHLIFCLLTEGADHHQR